MRKHCPTSPFTRDRRELGSATLHRVSCLVLIIFQSSVEINLSTLSGEVHPKRFTYMASVHELVHQGVRQNWCISPLYH